jgi:hypothetical protein
MLYPGRQVFIKDAVGAEITTQPQSGRDNAELARGGSRYLAEELIEFWRRGEGVKASEE